MGKITENLDSPNMVNMTGILKSVGLAYIITILLFLVLAVVLTYTEFPERLMPSVIVTATMVSIMFAGTSVARKARTKGWLNGAAAGLVYMLILYVVSSLAVDDFSIDGYVIFMAVSGMAAGAIGGIVGINLKKR